MSRTSQPAQSSMHRRKAKIAEGPLTTKGPEHAKPAAKNGKSRLRRWDKRSQKSAAERMERRDRT